MREINIKNIREFLTNRIRTLFGYPYMSLREKAKIQSYLKPHHIMLEFGSGNSTVHFSKRVGKYYSVEGNYEWYKKIKNSAKKAVLILAPDKKSYLNVPKRIGLNFDVVLIDGEWRVECAKSIRDVISKNTIVFVHDYYADDRDYREMLNWYRKIDSEGSLIVLKKK